MVAYNLGMDLQEVLNHCVESVDNVHWMDSGQWTWPFPGDGFILGILWMVLSYMIFYVVLHGLLVWNKDSWYILLHPRRKYQGKDVLDDGPFLVMVSF